MTAACLDWSDSGHWTRRRRDCRLCGEPTNLRDGAGRPAHKVCVEEAVDAIRREGTPSPQEAATTATQADQEVAS